MPEWRATPIAAATKRTASSANRSARVFEREVIAATALAANVMLPAPCVNRVIREARQLRSTVRASYELEIFLLTLSTPVVNLAGNF